MEAVGDLLDKTKCVRWHDMTPWRDLPRAEGDGWEQQQRRRRYRECRNCDHYEER